MEMASTTSTTSSTASTSSTTREPHNRAQTSAGHAFRVFSTLLLLCLVGPPAAEAQTTCTASFVTYLGVPMLSWGNDLGNWTNYASPSLASCLMDW